MTEHRITIQKNRGFGARFDPPVLEAYVGDHIFWENTDTDSHWPGLQNRDGTIRKTFFMPNQLPPSDVSSLFVPTEGTFNYACSLHPGETGTIVAKRNGGGGIGP